MALNPCAGTDTSVAFEPLAVTKTQAMRMVAMPKLVQRWLHHRWIEIVRPGGRGCETVIDFQSLKVAYQRFRKGEQPPPLPSELRAKKSNAVAQVGSGVTTSSKHGQCGGGSPPLHPYAQSQTFARDGEPPVRKFQTDLRENLVQ